MNLTIDASVFIADSAYISLAHESAAELITWDREMLERGASAVTTMTPADWLEKYAAAER